MELKYALSIVAVPLFTSIFASGLFADELFTRYEINQEIFQNKTSLEIKNIGLQLFPIKEGMIREDGKKITKDDVLNAINTIKI